MTEIQELDGLVPIVTLKLSGMEFRESLISRDLTNANCEDISGKKVRFERVNFSFSVFTRAYFNGAPFVECRFTGCRFYSCNFRGAEFSQCDFKYSFFDQTIIPTKEIIANAPEWPNVRRELMQILRANAISVGDIESQMASVREEMKARRDHLRRARERSEDYYRKKYSGFYNWCIVRWQSLWLWMDRNLLGYGEHIGRAVFGSAVLLVIIAIIQFLTSFDSSQSFTEVSLYLWSTVQYIFFLLLDVPDTEVRDPVFLAIIVILLRYFLIGLLVSALFRKLSHR